jgi:hypothetical protein
VLARGLTDGSAVAGVVSSTWTTASAPCGIGAPVAIRAAVPRTTVKPDGSEPAATSPISDRTAGPASVAPATSAARIA